MGFWDTLRKEIRNGIDEGLEALKEGTKALKHKTEIMRDDIWDKVKAFEIRQKIQVDLTELGGRVYDLSTDRRRNPLRDEKVVKIIGKIRKAEEQIAKLEGDSSGSSRKKSSTTRRKKASRGRASKITGGKK